MSKTNYYDVLEVNPGARKAVIDAAWKALSKEYGDTNPDRRILNEAHDVLSDEKSVRSSTAACTRRKKKARASARTAFSTR